MDSTQFEGVSLCLAAVRRSPKLHLYSCANLMMRWREWAVLACFRSRIATRTECRSGTEWFIQKSVCTSMWLQMPESSASAETRNSSLTRQLARRTMESCLLRLCADIFKFISSFFQRKWRRRWFLKGREREKADSLASLFPSTDHALLLSIRHSSTVVACL